MKNKIYSELEELLRENHRLRNTIFEELKEAKIDFQLDRTKLEITTLMAPIPIIIYNLTLDNPEEMERLIIWNLNNY